MLKKIIFIFFVIIFYYNYVFGYDTDYLEYADIPGTDIINMNGQFDDNIYQVYIDTGSIFYVTGSDNKLHNCFKLVGTGYTEKLGLIYFQYDNMGSYICDDYKLRGVFKIEAGGWGYMEDLENQPEKWKNFLDKTPTDGYFYHNQDGNGNGTGQAYLDGIGFSNWDTVRTKTDLSQFLSNIKISSQTIGTNIIANGKNTANINIILTYNGKRLINFPVNNIYFSSGTNADIEKNGQKISPFKYIGPLTTDENGLIVGELSSLNGNKNIDYKLNVKIGNFSTNYIGTTNSFTTPFDINFYLKNKETDKILVGRTNQSKLKLENIDSNITNIDVKLNSSSIYFPLYGDYFIVTTGNNIPLDDNYHDFRIDYNSFLYKDSIDLQYNLSGYYSFYKDGNLYKINLNNYKTNNQQIYKDGYIYSIIIGKPTDYVKADGKSTNNYNIYFLDRNGQKINNLDFDISLIDEDKNFDLLLDDSYQTGFFVNYDFDKTFGKYALGIYSYKPANNKSLKLKITNIKYNGYYSFNNEDIEKEIKTTFYASINSIFEDKILKINRENNIKYELQNNIGTTLTNPYFVFTGYAIDCNECNFEKGKVLSGDDFKTYNFDIFISSTQSPSAIVYSGYIQYKLNGNKGTKTVQIKQEKIYSPLLFIESNKIAIIGAMLTKKKIIGGVNYIATSLNINYFRNKIKKNLYENFIRGSNIETLIADKEIDLSSLTKNKYVYKCLNNELISIYGTYNHNISIFSLGCRINIKQDIIGNKGMLKIYAFSNNEVANLIENKWDIAGNIYINKDVKTIYANLFAEGSILTYKDEIKGENIFTDDRKNFRTQLFIKGKIFSKNTLGGGNRYSNGDYTILNGQKVNESINEGAYGIYGVKNIAQAYDMSFWKSDFVHSDSTYSTGDLSEYIYNKYNCSGNKENDNPLCYTVIIIEDSKK